ncbi:MAG: hypothetical protein K2J93_02145, partial [Anaeroplasmataceae bacterium]|nr:hypothetical protein [Anaeroplasmataceae bacterium]
MNYKMYRRLDLFVFLILMTFSSIISLFLFSNKSFQFYFSFTVLVLFITLVRWNYLGLAPYILSQAILSIFQICFFHTEVAFTLVANIGGALFLFVIPLVLTKYKKAVRKNPLILSLMLLLTYILIGLGKGIALLFVGDFHFFANVIFYIFNQEIYSIVISLI